MLHHCSSLLCLLQSAVSTVTSGQRIPMSNLSTKLALHCFDITINVTRAQVSNPNSSKIWTRTGSELALYHVSTSKLSTLMLIDMRFTNEAFEVISETLNSAGVSPARSFRVIDHQHYPRIEKSETAMNTTVHETITPCRYNTVLRCIADTKTTM